ncbi:MAG: hypothetical protein QNJ74_04045 [Trichodesmium sp. MO_231.B1]|nr:hypothetical protein [Trichodesmium sp. MO_231.B1]
MIISQIIPIPKNNAILPMKLQLLSNNNASVMFVNIIGIKSKYIMSFNPTPYSLFPTPYSQGDVARMHDKLYYLKQ